MKRNSLLTSLLVLITLCSCGGNNKKNDAVLLKQEDKTIELKSFEKKVKGYLSDVLEVVDGTYTLNYKAEYPCPTTIQVKIKSILKGNSKDYGLQDGNYGPLYLTICDKNGVPVASFPSISSSYQSDGLLKNMMTKKDENWILFENYVHHNKLPDNCASFIITSEERKEDTESSSDDGSTQTSDVGDEKFDKVLVDYEEYVDKFIGMMEKANKDDNIDALMDYPELLEKAKDLEKSLNKAKNAKSLSSEQLKRMAKIEMKMVKAASNMDKLQ